MDIYVEDSGYSKVLPSNFRLFNKEEQINWYDAHNEKRQEYERLYKIWEDSSNVNINLGIPSEKVFGYLQEYLRKYNININISYYYNDDNYKANDIISGEDFVLYQIYPNGNIGKNSISVDYHYIYVVSVTDNEIIVSSWGNKYIYKNNNNHKDDKILIKVNK